MNRSVEQALVNLIPRHNGALPPELIELASSLLAQSRNKASNLKADEEIGRTYVCANIACERLKTTLNLPKIEPKPPCPPRIYQKLYSYLDSTLVSTRKRTRASQSQAQPKATSTPNKPNPSPNPQSTPQSRSKAISERTPGSIRPGATNGIEGFRSNRTAKKGLRFQSNKEKDERVPPWVVPTARFLCRELGAPAAVPHVLAGVESILTLPCPGPEDGDADEQPARKKSKGKRKQVVEESAAKAKIEGKLPALVAAVYFFVKTRLMARDTTAEEYSTGRTSVLEVLGKARTEEGVVAKVGAEEDAWREWEVITKKDVDGWLLEISGNGWVRMDWFENIVEGGGVEGNGRGDAADGEPMGKSEGEGRDVMRRGIGTMLQDKVDYLSEAKRREYTIWKEAILARMEELDELVTDGATVSN